MWARAIWVLWLIAWPGWAFPVIPLISTPTVPVYLTTVPGLLGEAGERVWAALSDCRLYPEDATDPLLGALVAAAARGVEVRVLLERRESNPRGEQLAAFLYLREAGAEVSWDHPQTTMHTKLLLIDDVVVIGSTHWTKSALLGSVQVDLVIRSPALAASVGEYLELLYSGELDARAELAPPPWPEGAVLPLLEFPGAGLHEAVLPELLARAGREVDLLLYRFGYYPQYPDSPSNRLVEGLISALRRGVRVRILLEGGEGFQDLAEDNRLTASFLALHGAEVRLDPPWVTTHAKCLIVDGRDVVVSSANWSYYSLAKNVEAGVAFLDAPALAARLLVAFEALWREAAPP